MLSVNRWAIYCHFFGVAVNPRFLLSIRATKKRRISANMNTIYCHFSRPCEVKKRPFQSADKTNDPRKFTGDKLWITEVRTSIQVSHLYLRAPSGRACQTASECGRQAGGGDAFGAATGIFPSLQGLRPLRRYAAIPT